MQRWLIRGLFWLVTGSVFADTGPVLIRALPASVARALKADRIPPKALAVYMAPVNGNQPYWVYRADVPMHPASTMKLVTSYAALELLGPDYRWHTVLASMAPVKNGVLEGDLYIKGYGDPKLTTENIRAMLEALRAKGIQKITGDLILDGRWFQYQSRHTPFDDTPEFAYNVEPAALIFNFNAFKITAESDTERANLTIDPPLPIVTLNNALSVSVKKSCMNGRSLPKPVISEAGTGVKVDFTGKFPANCSGARYYQLIDSVRYVGSFFAMTWQELGGEWIGRVQEGVMPDNAQILYTQYSPELVSVIRDMNKFSNNMMARNIYLTLGAYGKPGQRENLHHAQQGILPWLQEKGLATQSLVLENGSGLSHKERISAALLGQIIREAMLGQYADQFESSLPVVGIDGTMQHRLVNHEIAGAAHIKTGTLDGVRAIAGTIDAPDGQKVVIVAILNYDDKEMGTAVLDEVLKYAWNIRKQDIGDR